DSGNLLGCLIAASHGLREKAEAPLVGPAVIEGLADTFGLAAESATAPREAASRLSSLLAEPPRDELAAWDGWLESLEGAAGELAGRTGPEAALPSTWPDRLVEQAAEWRAELAASAPWLKAVVAAEGIGELGHRWPPIRDALLSPSSLSAIVERADRLA